MKKTILVGTIVFITIALTGCGSDHNNPPPLIVTQILSDPTVDGDILVPVTGPIVITEGMVPPVQSVFAGIDPVTLAESRAFLDFPLGGPNGVPINAVISSATLDIVIDNVVLPSPLDTVPIRIDLVSFVPPLIASDFDRTILKPIDTIGIGSITSAEINTHVFIDVTLLMVTAQNLGLPNFQIRILEELGPVTPGLIEIDDTTGANRATLAPLLEVSFF